MRSTTLGFERKYNSTLIPRECAEFVDFAVSGLPEQPGNHKRIKAMNRKGPRPLGSIESRPLTIREAIPHFQRGTGLLDTRSKEAYVQAHIPGSVHLEADSQLSNRIGFVFPPDVPVILLLSDPSEYEQVVYSLARVGYDNVVGYLAEGLEIWENMGLPITAGDIQDVEPRELHQILQSCTNGDCPVVIDVREPWEYRQGHVPGAVLIPLGQLAARLGELDPKRPVALICATGNRSRLPRPCWDRRDSKQFITSRAARVHGNTVDSTWNIPHRRDLSLFLLRLAGLSVEDVLYRYWRRHLDPCRGKNHERLILVRDPSDYSDVLYELINGECSLEKRKQLALKSFQVTSHYDTKIAKYLKQRRAFP